MGLNIEIQNQVRAVLDRFNALVSTKNLQVMTEFASGDDVLLVGSETSEIAKGSREIEAFFTRLFARETTFSWEWERIEVPQAGDLAWFFAEGQVLLTSPQGQKKSLYRVSGVLERQAGRWLWRHYHGSEPVG